MSMKKTRAESGAIGGKAKNPNKGFGSKSPEQLRAIAMKGVAARRKQREKVE